MTEGKPQGQLGAKPEPVLFRFPRRVAPAAARAPRSKSETLASIAGTAQALATVVAIFAAGIWAYVKAEPALALTELQLKREQLAEKRVLNVSLTVTQLPSKDSQLLGVELILSNGGNRRFDLRFDDATTDFYVAKVEQIDSDGGLSFTDRRELAFSYHDMPDRLRWVELVPGAEPTRLHAVQAVKSPGVYLVRFVTGNPLATPSTRSAATNASAAGARPPVGVIGCRGSPLMPIGEALEGKPRPEEERTDISYFAEAFVYVGDVKRSGDEFTSSAGHDGGAGDGILGAGASGRRIQR